MQADGHTIERPRPMRVDHLPTYWFGRLVEAVTKGNKSARFDAQQQLKLLGYQVSVEASACEHADGS